MKMVFKPINHLKHPHFTKGKEYDVHGGGLWRSAIGDDGKEYYVAEIHWQKK